jgi:hypothetical protein
MGGRSIKRELIIGLEMSGLTSETGEIMRYRAINRWYEDDEFDEWEKPSVGLSSEVEGVLCVTSEQLAGCRPADLEREDFRAFLIG